tara:strand:- start:37480 stop:38127 length:648 start_codon:yes stop_codon:yes gene_type:complete
MKKLFKTHWVYFTGYILFIIITALILSLFSKQEIHLFINSYYSSVTDVFFKYVTNLGDGLAIAIVGIILLFINGRMALQVIVSGITSGLIAQLLKKVVFGPVARPSAFFKELGIQLHYVSGVDLHTSFTFPSGHATAVFTLITSLIVLQKTKRLDILFFILVILVSFSRVYLSQHFLADIFAGSIIGVITSILTYYFLFILWKDKFPRLDKPFIK